MGHKVNLLSGVKQVGIPNFSSPRLVTQVLCHQQDVTQGQFVERSKAGLNLEFSLSKTGYITLAK